MGAGFVWEGRGQGTPAPAWPLCHPLTLAPHPTAAAGDLVWAWDPAAKVWWPAEKLDPLRMPAGAWVGWVGVGLQGCLQAGGRAGRAWVARAASSSSSGVQAEVPAARAT